jgi:pimeloyl-ACP methyl ester carboxylesterase
VSVKKSTNGRSFRQTLQVRAFQVLERTVPAAGAKLLDGIWFRIPQVPEKSRRLRVELPESTRFELPFENGTVRGNIWGDGPVVYLVHGWGGWGLQLAALIPPLLADGFRVIAFDAPSHGDSDPGREGPKRSNVLEFADAFQAVVAAHGPAYGVVAHSLGAAALAQALKNGFSAGRIVFLATATDFRDGLVQYQAYLGFGPRTRERFLRRFTRKFGPMEGFAVVSLVDQLAEERELPALLAIHDRSDRETAAEGSVKVAAVWPGAQVQLTDGLGHNRVLWDPSVVESTRAFLATDMPADLRGPAPATSSKRAAADRQGAVQETMHG